MGDRLRDRVAIVTGAGRGVGRAVAILMASEGAKVVVADNGSTVDGSGRTSEPANTVVGEITVAGGTAIAAVIDVSVLHEARELVELSIEAWGKLDILVNCAGNFVRDTILDVTDENLAKTHRVHVVRMTNTSRLAALHWIDRAGYGRLINFTSDAAMSGTLLWDRKGRRNRADARSR
jgi:NAD(P)-dependent dehydrogenase (short-subunit alcohol dehydrogenase family)